MSNDRPIRWWPGATITLIALATLTWVWLSRADSSEQIRQSKVMLSAAIFLVWALTSVLWLLLFARLRARGRLAVVGALLVAGVAFFGLFRFRGVDGDLVPQFSFRYGGRSLDLGETTSSLAGVSDYAQFLGPDRNAVISGVSLARDWEAQPPKMIWRRPVGAGWAGFAVANGRAITQEQHSAEEKVVAYEVATGKVLWSSREVASYGNPIAGQGPRATPTIVDGVVYAMGATGLLTALAADSGELKWKRDVLKDHGAKLPEWGKSDSPLVLGERVFVSAGGSNGASLVGYDRSSGEPAVMGGADPGAYASPMLVTLAGKSQIVLFNANSVTGHDPETAALLWRTDWPRRQPNVAQPLLIPPDRLMVSAGYGIGSKMYRVRPSDVDPSEFAVDELWESRRLKAKFTNVVLYQGYIYGLDDGVLVCLDPETGKRMWKRGRYGHGQVLLVEDILLLQGEQGEVFLIDPSPDELKELTSFQALEGKTWNTPALAGKYLLVRNDREAALYELPVI